MDLFAAQAGAFASAAFMLGAEDARWNNLTRPINYNPTPYVNEYAPLTDLLREAALAQDNDRADSPEERAERSAIAEALFEHQGRLACCCEVVTGGPIPPTWPQMCSIHGHVYSNRTWILRSEEPDVMILGCPRCLDRWEFRGPQPSGEILAVIDTHQCGQP